MNIILLRFILQNAVFTYRAWAKEGIAYDHGYSLFQFTPSSPTKKKVNITMITYNIKLANCNLKYTSHESHLPVPSEKCTMEWFKCIWVSNNPPPPSSPFPSFVKEFKTRSPSKIFIRFKATAALSIGRGDKTFEI